MNEVTQVEFLVDGVSLGIDTDDSDGWSMTWNWTGAAEGNHTITAIATNDLAETGSADVVVVVDLLADVFMHVASLTGSSQTDKGGKWIATVTAAIVDDLNNPVEGATVIGTWDSGAAGSCTTGASGACDISFTNNKNATSATFTVTDVTHATFVYDATGPSEVTVTKP
jgi:hypothetical protein